MKQNAFLYAALLLLAACVSNKNKYDASGTFEAVETLVSPEVTGVIKELKIEEGQVLKQGDVIGYIDSVQLYLKKKQLEAQIKATGVKVPNIPVQTNYYPKQAAVTQSKLDNLYLEQKRTQNLIKADAATTKQLDDINAQIDETKIQLQVIAKQNAAQVSALETQTAGLRSDIQPLLVQIQQTNDQLSKCTIINQVNGTVLTKYAETNEMAVTNKPLYKIADLSTLTLRAYVSGDQLSTLKLNQKVKVLIDAPDGKYKEYEGIIQMISDKAEFTPKTIQTKDERANLVYAVKIDVKNDGFLKIGMYADVKF
ncbi:HlyD family secretion protein [Chitinophagaceae bacterium LWZ2-11]